ncbi:DUF1772 domain-containing protein [Amycolatopsis balhimycina DSM 5908]|uniref:DUF1772 domain-containing protein n=1 Tax=Amycolatopsis balhimycina DSM 5908 TaxID=1081091 RepID=A0A428WP79_AMYBA|nr:DUF1772 domain-containing protein [Amycolatopsis balhimycina]RSM44881.1 DUF1772 domain-containing protein [Amycolatopsis balhimycina DSM 5908]
MSGWQPVLGAVVTVVNGAAAGIMLSTVIGIGPMMCALPYPGYVRMVQFMRPRYDPIMPIANGSALVMDLVLVFGSDTARPLRVAAALLLAAVIAISAARNVPVNRYIMSLDPDHRPADWPARDPRSRWRAWNNIRTALATAAFVLNTAAVVW